MQQEQRTCAVVGTGQMGAGIAAVMASAGFHVALADASPETARAAKERLLEGAGRDAADIAARIECHDSIEDACRHAGYVTEAVREDPAVKREVLARISAVVPDGAVVATNTSAIPIRDLSGAVRDETRFLGVHWMYPPGLIPAVEVIPGPRTSEDTVRSAVSLLEELEKVPVVVADSPGFVANRLQFALVREAHLMLGEGLASAEDIDTVVSNSFGFRLAAFGPFLIGDMAGLDVYAGAYRTLEDAYGERFSVPRSIAEAVAGGRLGLKSGQGLLGDYPPERREELLALRDEAYAALLRFRRALPGPAQDIRTNHDTTHGTTHDSGASEETS
ncbi:3-hydroxyacyl-CoA dehydrogenase family protein [Kocuria sp. M1R5S2]|uniref:3-hydroxyacyl-CoA dehydrogenase family protein n=1 Tax=Kocuria rhizosphaerae TaxID=3376285 RepID=UPI00378CA226